MAEENILLSISNIFEYSKKGVFKVIREDGGSGTSFLFQHNMLSTAHHVIHPYKALNVIIDGSTYESELVDSDPSKDLAILRIINPPDNMNILNLDRERNSVLGDELLILGYPLGSNMLTIHKGILSAQGSADDFPAGKLREHGMFCPLLQIDGTINEGFSGGPVINIRTKTVVGYITTKYGILADFQSLRAQITDLLEDPFTLELSQRTGGVTIEGIRFGRLCMFLFNSIDILSKSMKYLHVGIGYAVDVECLLPYIG